MRRFLTLVCLLLLAIPAGISISGCTRNPAANYCNAQGGGMKITDVAAITLQPATTGLSIAYGQTYSVGAPSMVTCKGTSASATVTWGTTNRQLVDISPSGNICAGAWNRNSGGGIANYTICSPPNPLPSTNGLPYATAYITASAQTAVSNPVQVFVHAQVTSVSLVGPQTCLSQGQQAILDAQACYANGSNQQVQMCAPAGISQCPYSASDPRCNNPSKYYACPGGLGGATSIPSCTASIGTLSYNVGTPSIGNISTDTTTNQVTVTANQPGTTAVTASVAQSGSSAGYFSTCPPKSIQVTLANGATEGTITQGVTQNLVTTIYDTNVSQCPPTSTNPAGGCPITGLNLDYQSTDPIDISASGGGSITTSFPGVASVYAICQPTACNPSPINQIGLFGTGLPVSSNPVTITTPGTASDYVWFGAPSQSQYIVPVELLNGTVGSTVRLPYVPNSMIMDRLGNNLYFGSSRELMIVSVANGSLTKEDTSVPGVVLAVSPNGQQQLISDQVRQVFYIYSGSSGFGTTSFGGMGAAAAWTPDSKTLYITDSASAGPGHSDTLYVYSEDAGWTSCSAGKPCASNFNGATNLALTIPSVGAYLGGNSTVSRAWCPAGTVAEYDGMTFYPQGSAVVDASNNPVPNEALAATTDGRHILGAALTGSAITLSDIGVSIPALNCLPPESDPNYPLLFGDQLSTLSLTNTLEQTQLTQVSATGVNQVVASPESNLAFITYTAATTNTNALLPFYQPNQTNPDALGTFGYVQLMSGSSPSTTVTAPIAGAFTPDDKLFFVSTAGDNMIHYISVPLVTSDPTHADTQQISPNLPACTPGKDADCNFTGNGTTVPATAIAVKPRSVT
jgi:hypothetical protein